MQCLYLFWQHGVLPPGDKGRMILCCRKKMVGVMKKLMIGLALAGGSAWSMEESKEMMEGSNQTGQVVHEGQNIPLTVTQIAQKPVDEILKDQKTLFPTGAESVLRTATIDDLEGAVKLLEILKTPKKEAIKILDTMEKELFEKVGVDSKELETTGNKIAKYFHLVVGMDPNTHARCDGDIQVFENYIKIVNLQYHYGSKTDKEVSVLEDYEGILKEYFAGYDNSYTEIMRIYDLEGFNNVVRIRSLLSHRMKESIINLIYEYEDLGLDIAYADRLGQIKLFF